MLDKIAGRGIFDDDDETVHSLIDAFLTITLVSFGAEKDMPP